ncbi:hypothetical protein D3C76_757820 [compost metagenome]
MLSLSNPRSLTVNGDIVCLAADLAGDGIKLLLHFSNGSVKLISHRIDRIHGDAAVFRIDDKHRIAERVEIPSVLIELRIQAILHQPDFDARHPQLLLGIIQQLLSYLLALIQPGQLLLNAGDLVLDGSDLGTNDLDFIDFGLQDRNVELELGNLLYGPQQLLGQVALLYLPLQFVENVLHIPAGFSLNALHTLEGTPVILAVNEAHPVVKRGTLANGIRKEIGR